MERFHSSLRCRFALGTGSLPLILSGLIAGCLLFAFGPLRISGQAINPDPLSLEALLQEALDVHPWVQAGEARARAAARARSAARALPNPTLGYELEGAPPPTIGHVGMEREEMLLVSVPIQDLYQRWPRVQRAGAEAQVASAEASQQRLDVMLGSSAAFHRVALAQVNLETVRELKTWLDSVVAYDSVRVDEGVTAEVDLMRAQIERDAIASTEALAQAEWARAWGELGFFLEDPTPRPVSFAFVPLGTTLLSASAESAAQPDELVNRPDVRAARSRVAAADAAISEQRTMLVSEMDVTVGVKQSGGLRSLVAAASLPLPLFNQNRGETGRALAERDASRLELSAVERAAQGNVRAAREAQRVLTARVTELSVSFLSRADEARRISFGMYQEGAAPLLHVIDAARAWADARGAFFELLFAQHQSVVDLIVATGLSEGQTLPFPIR